MKRLLSTLLIMIACVAIGFCGINNTLDQANSMYATAKTVADYQRVIKKYESAKFDIGYVAAEHDKAINEGIRKCNARINELRPRLSIDGSSSPSVYFSSGGGSRSLSISTNQGTPYVNYLPGWLSINSISSSGISIYCSENASTSSRSGSFTVYAGNASATVSVSQGGAQRTSSDTYLKVDNSTALSESFGASGGTRTYYVQTDASSWSTWGIPSWCEVTEKTSTSFTLRCLSNSSSSSRSDYMKIKTNNHDVRIDITQSGTSSSSATAEIENVWVEHNVTVDGKNGLAVHAKFTVQNMKGKKVGVGAYFYDSTNINAIKDTNGEYCTTGDDPQVAESVSVTPNYDNTRFDDVVVKIPYSELHQYGSSTVNLTVDVILWDRSVSPSEQITRKNNTSFSFVPSPSTRSGKINRVWVDYDQWQNGLKGMMIHTEFETEHCNGDKLAVCIYFYTESGDQLNDYDNSYKTSDGKVAIHEDTNTTYVSSIWNDFKLFMPYDQLHMASGKHDLKFYVGIYDYTTGEFLATSEYQHFTFTK